MRNRIRRGDVDRPTDVILRNQPFNRTAKVLFMDPREDLVHAGHGTPESVSGEPPKNAEHAALAWREDHRRPQCDLACCRRVGLVERLLPGAAHLDREGVLGFWCRSNDAGGLVHWAVEGMLVDRCRARVQPNSWRLVAAGDRLAQHARGVDPRVENLPPVAFVVTAIHGSRAEIAQRSRTVELFRPVTQGTPIPADLANRPRRSPGRAR